MQIFKQSVCFKRGKEQKVVDEIFFPFSVKSIVLHLAEECKVDELGSVIDAYSVSWIRRIGLQEQLLSV